MNLLSFLTLLNLALAFENYVQLNAFKLYGDGQIEQFDHQIRPHLLVAKSDLSKRENYIEGQIKYTQLTYFAELEVGSSKDKVLVSLDTGSADLWVNSSQNELCLTGEPENSNDVPEESSASSPESSSIVKASISASVSVSSASDFSPSDARSSVRSNLASTSTVAPKPVDIFDGHLIHRADDNSCYIVWEDTRVSLLRRDDEQINKPDWAFFGNNCSSFGVYNPLESNSLKDTGLEFEIRYADGSTSSGDYVKDDIFVAGAKVDGVTFGLVDNSTVNGIWGLGFASNQAGYQNLNQTIYNSVLQNMKDQGLVNRQVYSLKASLASRDYHSDFLFGAYDKNSYVGPLNLLPIKPYVLPGSIRRGDGPHYISVTLNAISYDNDNSPFASGAAAVVFDTGSVGSYLPEYILLEIVSHYGFEYSNQLSVFVISDSQLSSDAKLKFNFQGLDIEVPLIYFTYPILDEETKQYSNLRMLSFLPSDYYLLGDDFLSVVSLIVDLESNQIALAQANLNQTSEDIVVIQDTILDAVKAPQWDNTFNNAEGKLLINGTPVSPDDILMADDSNNSNLNPGFVLGESGNVDWV